MSNLGIDYSFARPSPAAIKAGGFKFVCRYLSTYTSKRIDKPEADSLRAQGLSIVLVFEDSINEALAGHTQGDADAKVAVPQANAIGFGSDRPIYFAVDFDGSKAQMAAIIDYFRGVGAVIGVNRVGVYGGYDVVKACLDAGVAKYGWQTVAWSRGQLDSRAHIYQNGSSVFNGQADVDEARQNDFGQWPIEDTVFTQEAYNAIKPIFTQAGVKPPPDALVVGTETEGALRQLVNTPEWSAVIGKMKVDKKSLATLDQVVFGSNPKPPDGVLLGTFWADAINEIPTLPEYKALPKPQPTPSPSPDPSSVTVTETGLWAAFKRFLGIN